MIFKHHFSTHKTRAIEKYPHSIESTKINIRDLRHFCLVLHYENVEITPNEMISSQPHYKSLNT